VTLEHQKKPGAGNAALHRGPSSHSHEAPGKRTLTEGLPHHAGHAGHAAHETASVGVAHGLEADTSEPGSALNVALIAGKPSGAVEAPVPAKDATGPAKDAKSGHPTPRAHAASAPRPLTLEEATSHYAPLVYLARNEANRPANASEYIANSSLNWSHDSGRKDQKNIAKKHHINEGLLGSGGYKGQTEGLIGGPGGPEIPSNADVRPKDKKGAGGSEGFYLNLDNANRASRKSGLDAPVYFEAKNHHYITYWFFYAFNDGPTQGKADGVDDHEGDWERICVRLDGNNRATEVAYFQHEGHKTMPWSAVPKSGSHPIVYSAKGSHASYTTPGPKPIYKHTFAGNVKIATDQPSAGKQWHTQQHLLDAHKQAWYGYGGAWGEVGDTEISTGPQGPSHHKAPAPDGW
jgi:hypothetical protein